MYEICGSKQSLVLNVIQLHKQCTAGILKQSWENVNIFCWPIGLLPGYVYVDCIVESIRAAFYDEAFVRPPIHLYASSQRELSDYWKSLAVTHRILFSLIVYCLCNSNRLIKPIFYLSHSYSMGQIIKPVCLCPCCPSACTLTLAFLDGFFSPKLAQT